MHAFSIFVMLNELQLAEGLFSQSLMGWFWRIHVFSSGKRSVEEFDGV